MKKKQPPKKLYLSLDRLKDGGGAFVLTDETYLEEGEEVAVYEFKKMGELVKVKKK